jgi:hypothetical protein
MEFATVDFEDMNCPKCGFQQADGRECPRCGIVFSRLRVEPPSATIADPPKKPVPKPPSRFRPYFRIFRWSILAVAIATILLVLHASKAPLIILPPDAGQQAEEKIHRFNATVQTGAPDRLKLDQSELNAWLSDNLALKQPAAAVSSSLNDTSTEREQSSIRDVKIVLLENSLRLYAIFDAHGIDLSLELEGNLFTRDGYIGLDPTAGKLGSLPLISGSLRAAVDRVFNSPENREKFKLPPEIKDVRIERGELLVTSR